MPDYEKMYHIVCSAASEAIDALEREDPAAAKALLRAAMLDAEELYVSAEEK